VRGMGALSLGATRGLATCLRAGRPPTLSVACGFSPRSVAFLSTWLIRKQSVGFSAQRERAMADQVPWHLSGDCFENCSCSVVCPCLVSAAAPLTARPTEGFCNVPLIFHVETGRYGDVRLDGLNFLVILHAPGVMADGDWSAGTYVDQRADD